MMEEGCGELWQEYKLLSHTNWGSNSQRFSNPYCPTEMRKKRHAQEYSLPYCS